MSKTKNDFFKLVMLSANNNGWKRTSGKRQLQFFWSFNQFCAVNIRYFLLQTLKAETGSSRLNNSDFKLVSRVSELPGYKIVGYSVFGASRQSVSCDVT